MEASKRGIFDGHKHNSLVLQRLKRGKEKRTDGNSEESGERPEDSLGRIFRETSQRNELNAFRMVMSGEIQRISSLRRPDALCKFMVLAYSKMLFALIGLRGSSGLEDVRAYTLEFRKLNYIFRNCVHFNIKAIPGKDQTRVDFKEEVGGEISVLKREEQAKDSKMDIFERMESLNSSVNSLKMRIKSYFSSSIQEKINVLKGVSSLSNESLASTNSDSRTDLCVSDSSSLENLNDGCSTNSEEEPAADNTEDQVEKKAPADCSKQGFRHRRSVETILFTGNRLENAPLVEFSPAPRYHSRSKTQNTTPPQHDGESGMHIPGLLPFNGVLLQPSRVDPRPVYTSKAQKIIESANLNQKVLLRSSFGCGSPQTYVA
ncbi:hypothetical protein OIY81_3259 [Cryptosporidium canis]|uniref:Uncharacterized protein n=1 Tax=Cryptosporidium canis TaxID=195482 RepID=A0ABQ8P3I1_9CRYT|nr:hypothetical protein OIY81_3259 [Cryptosporidium canis]KAJ1606866.1 hypothetical protein OJ252_3055 [Cryptosporidium canis]